MVKKLKKPIQKEEIIDKDNNYVREELYLEIRSLINDARKRVRNYANATLLFVYWNIGKMIVEEQGGEERAKYGDNLIKELSMRLTNEFGEGFDKRNLRKIRQFYLMFKMWASVRPELSWTHYRTLIMIKEQHIRKYYIEEAVKGNWSVRQLERQINTCAYSRSLNNMIPSNFIENDNDKLKIDNYEPKKAIKDPYVLEFLGLDTSNYKEKDLEEALITHLQKFLLELGRGFTFVARQKRISYDNEHYYIDLVFYNIILRCYVVIDLKMEKLTHEALGQIDLYRNYYDLEVKSKDDNPTIGLLLVTDQDTLVAKYSSIYKDDNIFVSKYMTYLPSEEELERVINEERRLIEEYKLIKSKE